jgi:hypothetical protein
MSEILQFGFKIVFKIETISNIPLHSTQTKWAESNFCSSLIGCVFCFYQFYWVRLSHQLSFSDWGLQDKIVQDGWIHVSLIYGILTIYKEAGRNARTTQRMCHECFLHRFTPSHIVTVGMRLRETIYLPS